MCTYSFSSSSSTYIPIPSPIRSNPIPDIPSDVPNISSAMEPPVHAENPSKIRRAGVPYAIAAPNNVVPIFTHLLSLTNKLSLTERYNTLKIGIVAIPYCSSSPFCKSLNVMKKQVPPSPKHIQRASKNKVEYVFGNVFSIKLINYAFLKVNVFLYLRFIFWKLNVTYVTEMGVISNNGSDLIMLFSLFSEVNPATSQQNYIEVAC